MSAPPRILVLGYGNPGRLDDGLGPAFVDALEALHPPHVTFDSDYQLNVEDASLAAVHDVVVFVDAAVDGPEPFSFRPVTPQLEVAFSTHSVSPAAVLGLAATIFGRCPDAYILGIRGHAFNAFGETLSPQARQNLHAALEFFVNLLRTGELHPPPAARPPGAAALSGSQR